MANLPVLTREQCEANLRRGTTANFDRVIVYMPRFALGNGRYTSEKGKFVIAHMRITYWHGGDDDWDLGKGVFQNEHGVSVKPVYVMYDDEKCFESFLFSRIRKLGSKKAVSEILFELNSHLELYKDDLRYAIAQEWCGQEPWRIFPTIARDCIRPIRDLHGNTVAWHTPSMMRSDLKRIMDYMLPYGYDDKLPAKHLCDEPMEDSSDEEDSDIDQVDEN